MAKPGGVAGRRKDGVGAAERLPRAGGRLQQRRTAKPRISKRQVGIFFAALADSCNVTASANAAGFSTGWAYGRRKTDAAFRAAWRSAIDEGYAKLELALLERALVGTEKIVTRRDGSEERVREYPNAIALQLLRQHREGAAQSDADVPETDIGEVRERLQRKLERLARREAAKAEHKVQGPQIGAAE